MDVPPHRGRFPKAPWRLDPVAGPFRVTHHAKCKLTDHRKVSSVFFLELCCMCRPSVATGFGHRLRPLLPGRRLRPANACVRFEQA